MKTTEQKPETCTRCGEVVPVFYHYTAETAIAVTKVSLCVECTRKALDFFIEGCNPFKQKVQSITGKPL